MCATCLHEAIKETDCRWLKDRTIVNCLCMDCVRYYKAYMVRYLRERFTNHSPKCTCDGCVDIKVAKDEFLKINSSIVVPKASTSDSASKALAAVVGDAQPTGHPNHCDCQQCAASEIAKFYNGDYDGTMM